MTIKNIKKRFLTLIEMMIVMFIIAMITGGLAYRYVGSLDESRAFKTKVSIERLSGILNLKAADDPAFLGNLTGWEEMVAGSPLVSNPKDIINDGWGQRFQVDVVDGTPLLDIKPFAPPFDHRDNCSIGWMKDKIDNGDRHHADERFCSQPPAGR